ncbi:MAG: alkaline phosphatase D family protein [Cytophagales bacterium]
MFRVLFFSLALFFSFFSLGQKLMSGPMVGAPAMREVTVWLQTDIECNVQIQYFKVGSNFKMLSSVFKTSRENAYTAKIALDGLEPSQKYTYQVLINNIVQKIDSLSFITAPLWTFGRAPVPVFSVAMGSCHFTNEAKYDRPGKPYGQDSSIFATISKKKPDLMLWLGDNVYLREVDYDSRSGIFARYTHTRQMPYMVDFIRKSHHIAIWDDHDYGPNDSDRSYYLKQHARDAFKAFWPNPSFGLPDYPNEGVTSFYEFGDAEFYLLDNRWWRSPKDLNDKNAEMLGSKQIQWLIDALKTSKAAFKIICVGSQMINPNTKFENFEAFETEKSHLFSLIEKHDIKGVLFVSGDRHFSEISKLERVGKYPLYEITTSPLTSSSINFEEKNKLRVEGSFINQQNFSVFYFSGAGKDRILTIKFFDKQGKELLTHIIQASDLK